MKLKTYVFCAILGIFGTLQIPTSNANDVQTYHMKAPNQYGHKFTPPMYKGRYFMANRRADYVSYPSFGSHPSYVSYPAYGSHPVYASYPAPQSAELSARQNYSARADLVCQFLGKNSAVQARSKKINASPENPAELLQVDFISGKYWTTILTSTESITFFSYLECQ